MQQVRVVLSKNGHTFLVECPYAFNDMAARLPNRRWSKLSRAWLVPNIRLNRNVLNSWVGNPAVDFSEEAAELLRSSEIKTDLTVRAFPSWYKFKREPRLAQSRYFERMYAKKFQALFMEMRTGKTKVVIDSACAMRMEGLIDHMLLVCPINLRLNWINELKKDATIPYDVHVLSTHDKGKAFTKWLTTVSDFKILIVGVESLGNGSAHIYVERFLQTTSQALMAIDESQSIKNHKAHRAASAVKLGKYAKYRTIMTGTPIAKNPLDLYMQFEFLDPNILGCGDFYSFRGQYAMMGGYENREIIGFKNQDELMDLISGHIYQVTQADAIDVPPKSYEVITVPLTEVQHKMYKTLAKTRSLFTDNGELLLETMMQTMQRLHEVSGGFYATENKEVQVEGFKKPPKYIHHSIEGRNPKLEEVMRLVEDISGSVIIWCAYKLEIYAVVAALREKYGHNSVGELHGDINPADRFKYVEAFQAGTVRFMVGNAATGGAGLTLSRAETMIYYSSTFALLDRQQSEERATGDTPVLVIDILAEGTVDFAVREALNDKSDLSDYVRKQIAHRVPYDAITAPPVPF